MLTTKCLCELQPSNIKLFDHIPYDVCMCSYHENIRLLLVALKEHTELSVNFQGFINQVTCDSSQNSCMSNECNGCKNKIDDYAPNNPADPVKFHQWLTNDKIER